MPQSRIPILCRSKKTVSDDTSSNVDNVSPLLRMRVDYQRRRDADAAKIREAIAEQRRQMNTHPDDMFTFAESVPRAEHAHRYDSYAIRRAEPLESASYKRSAGRDRAHPLPALTNEIIEKIRFHRQTSSGSIDKYTPHNNQTQSKTALHEDHGQGDAVQLPIVKKTVPFRFSRRKIDVMFCQNDVDVHDEPDRKHGRTEKRTDQSPANQIEFRQMRNCSKTDLQTDTQSSHASTVTQYDRSQHGNRVDLVAPTLEKLHPVDNSVTNSISKLLPHVSSNSDVDMERQARKQHILKENRRKMLEGKFPALDCSPCETRENTASNRAIDIQTKKNSSNLSQVICCGIYSGMKTLVIFFLQSLLFISISVI